MELAGPMASKVANCIGSRICTVLYSMTRVRWAELLKALIINIKIIPFSLSLSLSRGKKKQSSHNSSYILYVLYLYISISSCDELTKR